MSEHPLPPVLLGLDGRYVNTMWGGYTVHGDFHLAEIRQLRAEAHKIWVCNGCRQPAVVTVALDGEYVACPTCNTSLAWHRPKA